MSVVGCWVALLGTDRQSGTDWVVLRSIDDTPKPQQVNPRVQVEHTVTEEVTGIDIVQVHPIHNTDV